MSVRNIETWYYHGTKPVKVNKAKYREKAVQNALMHLQNRKYKANNCEVFDSITGKLLAAVKINVKDSITILFKKGF